MNASRRTPRAPTTAQPPARRSHDAAATRQHIADAAVTLLLQSGFTALGINALAQAAAVDKQLIYYHFGGLDGVVRHLGAQVERWLGGPLQVQPGEPYGMAVTRLLGEYHAALRASPLLLRLLAWELAEPSPTLAELEQARSQAMGAWVQALRRDALAPPAGVDAPAVNAVLLAALQYLTLREQSAGSFAGIDLRADSGRQRIADAVAALARGVYAGADPTPPEPPLTQP
jgi:AcrR family transcriptional regulator